MIANIIAYGSALLLLSIGIFGICMVASDREPKGKGAAWLAISAVFIATAWTIAHLAGI